jgi:hypothetical protein
LRDITTERKTRPFATTLIVPTLSFCFQEPENMNKITTSPHSSTGGNRLLPRSCPRKQWFAVIFIVALSGMSLWVSQQAFERTVADDLQSTATLQDANNIAMSHIQSPIISPNATTRTNDRALDITASNNKEKETSIDYIELHSDPFPPITRQRVCLLWSLNSDDWWTHHPDWFIAVENDTHYCFDPLPEDSEKAVFMRNVYRVQFETNCSNVVTLQMWHSGWGADYVNIVNKMDLTMAQGQPLQTQLPAPEQGWNFAAREDGSGAACPLRSQYCYFLNMSQCDPVPSQMVNDSPAVYGLRRPPFFWYMEFVTRQQTWLRKTVYDYTKSNFQLQLPCSAIHVRRSDVLLENHHSRRYHPIEEYLNASYNLDRNILLITDDQNAIPEAKVKFPEYNWMYENRTRFHGAEGGWQNPFPSGDPKYEVIVLLATFKAVRQCRKLVRSESNMGILLEGILAEAWGENNFEHYNVDDYKVVTSATFIETKNVSKSNWTAEDFLALSKPTIRRGL